MIATTLTMFLLDGADQPGIDTGSAGQWVGYLLAGGGAVGIFTLVKAFLAVRNGVEVREGKAIENLEQWRKDADERADKANARADRCADLVEIEREWGRYWQIRAARSERALVAAGVDVPPEPLRPTRNNE